MGFTEINSDNKISINLSQSAMDIVKYDMFTFGRTSLSTFINELFTNYYKIAKSSISLSIKNKEDEYKTILKDFNSHEKLNMIDCLLSAYKDDLLKKSTSYGKGESIKLRINKSNMDYLTNDCEEDKYYTKKSKDKKYEIDSIGLYLKAIVEEYCSLEYLERERIFFSNIFIAIEDAIKQKVELKLTDKNSAIIRLKPYTIISDPLSMYYYLLGYSIEDDGNGNIFDKPYSCRISRLKAAKRTKKDIFISEEKRQNLIKTLQIRGSQFLGINDEIIQVRLTNNGIAKYNTMMHLRPTYTKIEGNLYTFNCTPLQIEYYFFKFGGDVEILSPVNLRTKFKTMYTSAVNNYN